MLSIILAMVLLVALVAIPLGWRIRADRRRHEADVLRADILSAVNRRLGGESLLSVEVVPEALGHSGRIVLWTPKGYEGLAETVWRDVVKRSPAGYDLIIRPGRGQERGTTARVA